MLYVIVSYLFYLMHLFSIYQVAFYRICEKNIFSTALSHCLTIFVNRSAGMVHQLHRSVWHLIYRKYQFLIEHVMLISIIIALASATVVFTYKLVNSVYCYTTQYYRSGFQWGGDWSVTVYLTYVTALTNN